MAVLARSGQGFTGTLGSRSDVAHHGRATYAPAAVGGEQMQRCHACCLNLTSGEKGLTVSVRIICSVVSMLGSTQKVQAKTLICSSNTSGLASRLVQVRFI